MALRLLGKGHLMCRQCLLPILHPWSTKHASSAVYAWGAANSGQLGTQTTAMETEPVISAFPIKVSHVGCGDSFTVVSEQSSKKVTLAGLNIMSTPGLSGTTKHGTRELVYRELPVQSSDSKVLQIDCGRSHVMILTDEGVFAAGANTAGQCGVGLNKKTVDQFTQVLHTTRQQQVKQVACGLDHSLLLTQDGQVLSCGWGADGQTGLGHYANCFSTTQVAGEIRSVHIKQVASAGDSCLALSEDGQVFSWGNNEYSQLGLETTDEQVCEPTPVSLLEQLGEVTQVGAAGSFSVALTATGAVYSWGYGVLGHGRNVTFVKTPKRLDSLIDSGHQVSQLVCGTDHVALTTGSGNLFVWGRGGHGRLGLGTTKDQWTPKQVHLPGHVTEVSCCVDHMTAIVETT